VGPPQKVTGWSGETAGCVAHGEGLRWLRGEWKSREPRATLRPCQCYLSFWLMWFFKTGSHYRAQAGLRLAVLLALPRSAEMTRVALFTVISPRVQPWQVALSSA
jgi:hypothetical protein